MSSHRPAPRPGAEEPVRRPFGLPASAGGAGWGLRLLRAVPFALVCTLLAALGHQLAQGCPVATGALAVGFVAVLLPAAALGGRERSLPGIAAALGLGQLGLHLLFHTAAQAAMDQSTLAQVAGRLVCNDMPGMAHMLPPGTSAAALVGAAGLDPHAYQAPVADGPWWLFGLTPAMLAGHLLAAVLVGWWLRCGEAGLWRVVGSTGRAVRELRQWTAPLYRALALLAVLLRGLLNEVCRPRPARARREHSRLPAAALLRHSVIRRGPPAAAWTR
ncbi:hypothetical protein P3T35_003470 [Kitasatospora sp. GP30]|uniref:hypothetical protein n=1 Tax=Kitasatospora sp. GP30 TaxID=3035084 RepID=UPI000CC2F6D5|nr:hypothetical protein [Kitasatospora sp. GP30]MDH6141451.1 hypothetical protein [Kitasatospora sp. GP30]